MTNIKVKRVPLQLQGCQGLQDELQMIVEGHAGYQKKGEDIVCAAVSVLVQSFAAFLAGVGQDFLYDFSVEGVQGEGSVAICAIPTRRGWQFICGAFECISTGFFLLAKTYPNNVSIRVNPFEEEL